MPKLIEDGRPAELSLARRRARVKTILTILAALVLAPLTAVVGMAVPGNGYYLSGTLIVLYAIVPFFVSFEGRRPTAREIAVVAVLTALAVAARAAFIWVPHFKPMAAVIMIAGLAAGPQTGFLVGSVAALASNFIFGQGPWTPWQMYAWGLVGYLAGVLADAGLLERRGVLMAYGFASGLLFGLLMNSWTLVGFTHPITWQTALLVYGAGLPFDLVHAVSTVVFLLVIYVPWRRKLLRVRDKFAL